MKKLIFDKSLIFLLVILVILNISLFLIDPVHKGQEDSPSVKIASNFLDALTKYDLNTARTLAAGTVLANLAKMTNMETEPSPYAILSKTIDVINMNSHWVRLRAEVETKNRKTGVIDVHWYEIYLVCDGKKNNWRVYRLDETEPSTGKEGKLRPQDKAEAIKVINQYLTLLEHNQYDQAGEMLIGKAKTAHEQAKPVLGKTPVIKQHRDLQLYPLFFDGYVMIAQARYVVDGRKTVVAISFFWTSEGWRIYNVSQI